MQQRLRHVRERMEKLKHWWLTFAFVGGFFLDIITLGRVDQLFAMIVLAFHILNAGTNLLLLYAATAGKIADRPRVFVLKYAPLLVQFSFGSLLSGTLVFYSQSGSFAVAWPFLLAVLLVMIGNEIISDRTERLILNLSIFFLGVFSYCVLFVPVFLKRMGPLVFVGSGLVALLFIVAYVRLLRLIVPNFIGLHIRNIIFALGMLYAAMHFLYFGNIIPPIPLSLRHIDIYHNVEKVGTGSYRLTYEPAPWYKFWRDADTTFRSGGSGRLYCFASVFAPTAFSLKIFHHWEYYDTDRSAWVTRARIPYQIEGGGDNGYRGYSYLEGVHAGQWRCGVETERGQLLGRETFSVVREAATNLVTQVE